MRAFLNSQARLIKGRQAQLQAAQQAWKRDMRALAAHAGGGEQQGKPNAAQNVAPRVHAVVRGLALEVCDERGAAKPDDLAHTLAGLGKLARWQHGTEEEAAAAAATAEGGGAAALRERPRAADAREAGAEAAREARDGGV